MNWILTSVWFLIFQTPPTVSHKFWLTQTLPRHRAFRKEAVLLELTVCYEENFANRKSAAYLELATTAKQNGYNVQLITLEVGSPGFICIDGFLELCEFLYISKAKWRQLLCAAAAATTCGSYRIWISRNHSPT